MHDGRNHSLRGIDGDILRQVHRTDHISNHRPNQACAGHVKIQHEVITHGMSIGEQTYADVYLIKYD